MATSCKSSFLKKEKFKNNIPVFTENIRKNTQTGEDGGGRKNVDYLLKIQSCLLIFRNGFPPGLAACGAYNSVHVVMCDSGKT